MTPLPLALASALALVPAASLRAGDVPAAERRPLAVDDLFALKEVGDPRLSPDGRAVAYTVASLEAKEDESDSDVYLVPVAGGEPLRLTASKKDETHPRFSPDGEWLAFLSDREGKKTQVWLMSRRGGEAVKLTDYKGGVADLAWSPDSKRLALIVADFDPDASDDEQDDSAAVKEKDKKKTTKPIVLRRLQFKRDGEGYLKEARRHVHVFEVAAKTSLQVTSGPFDDSDPAWSPDSRAIAFVSNRTLPDPDRSQDQDVFVVEARDGAVPRAIAPSPGTDASPTFSPDGKWIAFVAGGDPKDLWYGANHLAIAPVAGGESRSLTPSLDRNVASPRFAADGRSLLFLVEDRGNQHLARVGVEGGEVERVVDGEREVEAFDVAPGGAVVVLESSAGQPAEVSLLEATGLRRLTHTNDSFLSKVELAPVQRFQATSRDGTVVDGFLTLPRRRTEGRRLPTILRIHGGPASQFSTAFELEWQLLAAHGYAVVAANPRGSTGRGTAYSRAIWADWGNKDYEDVMAAVDHAVAKGVADPERLGVGGWSYGGILTDYVITKTGRFKAAVSGASAANFLAGYGTDHYQYEYEVELGLPWQARQVWLDLSSPFFNVEKVTTPTLFLCGALDMNVPLLNSEQLYQALRRVGRVDTELVVYPDQWHAIEKPSYRKDRWERYLAWYDRYLRPPAVAEERRPEATSLLGLPLYAPELPEETRQGLEEKLALATAEFVKNPTSAEAAITLGRRTAALGRFREAIEVYSRAIALHPNDPRLLRHRGHRYLTVRELDKALADLTRAASLAAGRPDQPEPDLDPSRPPTTTLQREIEYHLGVAQYVRGDFAAAEKAFRRCLQLSQGSADGVVSATDWLYSSLRRLGRDAGAARLLEPIREDLQLTHGRSYLNRLLLYKGVYTPEDLLRAGGDELTRATYGYAVGSWYLWNGRPDEARATWERVAASPQWPAFGRAAAEAELARMGSRATR
ncbi:MAG TPA: prolyl oligopeptidase family serine peptidase [Vicinamibacteria bacterium]|nr:prolyl oligopeptidase family serine peptidase [Vicinamibacteria bacterium]